MSASREKRILACWDANARAWIGAVRSGAIESRRLVTDQAVLEAVTARQPESVLDIGCGEGWLARELASSGCKVLGTDSVPALVDEAAKAGPGEYLCLSYAELGIGLAGRSFDLAVCNFSLLGNDTTRAVFRAAVSLLAPGGALVVQTLHPVTACGELPYEDGWREGSWDGFGPEFVDPAPWYFRTMESWQALFVEHGFELRERREPLHPVTGLPASVILLGERAK